MGDQACTRQSVFLVRSRRRWMLGGCAQFVLLISLTLALDLLAGLLVQNSDVSMVVVNSEPLCFPVAAGPSPPPLPGSPGMIIMECVQSATNANSTTLSAISHQSCSYDDVLVLDDDRCDSSSYITASYTIASD